MILLLAVVAALAVTGRPTSAQVAITEPASAGEELTMQELQGLSCLMFGGTAMVGSLAYVELLAAATATASAPLIAPVLATAFVAGCGVGQILSPGLLWIYRRVQHRF